MSRWPSRGGCARTPGGPVYCLPGHSLSHVLGHPVCSAQGGVLGCGTVSQAVSVVCVPSLSVVQPFVCWSDPMALVAPTLWGSGASRRRQSLPDDLHASQSCPDALRTVVPAHQPPLPIGELLLRGATAARRRGSRRADQPFLCLLLEQAVPDDLRPFEQPGDLVHRRAT